MQRPQQLTSTLDNWDIQWTMKPGVDKSMEEFQVFPGSINRFFQSFIASKILPPNKSHL